MTLQSSGKISLGNIKQEFIKMINPNPPKLSAYYGIIAGIPKSGLIKFSDFYGKSARISKTISTNALNVNTDNLFTNEERYSGAELEITISNNVFIGSYYANIPSLIIGNNNNAPKIILNNYGYIYGAAGDGNIPYGGTALRILVKNIEINNKGNIFGGGGIGGYGGYGGSGGAGYYDYLGAVEGPYFSFRSDKPYYWWDYVDGKTEIYWNGNNIYLQSGLQEIVYIDGTKYFKVDQGDTGWKYRRSISRQPSIRQYTSGGAGGAGGGIVLGRGYNNQGGSLNANAGLAGSVGGTNAGYGGNGGNSGYGGDWGSAGSSGQAGNTGGNGNNGNGYGGSAGQSGGAGGYAVHLATLPNDDIRNITWINSGNILGNIIKSISTDRS